jgi:response regulator of citrate/malate metabolism
MSDLFEFAHDLEKKRTPVQTWRNGDPETSLEAGVAAESFVSEHHAAIILTLKSTGRAMAAEEIADFIGWSSHVTANRRLAELADSGIIVRTEERHKNRSGRSAFRYRLTGEGPVP